MNRSTEFYKGIAAASSEPSTRRSPRCLQQLFEKAGTSVALLWYSDQVPSDELAWDRVDVTVKGVAFQNPVYVEMITGKVYDLDKSAWKSADGNTKLTQLPMWDSPMMLAEREQVELRKDGKP